MVDKRTKREILLLIRRRKDALLRRVERLAHDLQSNNTRQQEAASSYRGATFFHHTPPPNQQTFMNNGRVGFFSSAIRGLRASTVSLCSGIREWVRSRRIVIRVERRGPYEPLREFIPLIAPESNRSPHQVIDEWVDRLVYEIGPQGVEELRTDVKDEDDEDEWWTPRPHPKRDKRDVAVIEEFTQELSSDECKELQNSLLTEIKNITSSTFDLEWAFNIYVKNILDADLNKEYDYKPYLNPALEVRP